MSLDPAFKLPPRHLSLDIISANYTQHIKYHFPTPVSAFSSDNSVLSNGSPIFPGAKKEHVIILN